MQHNLLPAFVHELCHFFGQGSAMLQVMKGASLSGDCCMLIAILSAAFCSIDKNPVLPLGLLDRLQLVVEFFA
jgi:hypothetical protein